MIGKINQRLKGKTVGSYNDLDREADKSGGDGGQTSTFASSMFSGSEGNGGLLGSAIEMSAAGAGVVPDG